MRRGIASFFATGIIGVLPLFITSCGNSENTEIVETQNYEELKVLMLGNEPQNGMDEIYERLDTLTTEELGCIVRFTFIPWGNERERLNIAVASGEYDIIPNGNFSDYKKLINKKAFLDLTSYLDEVPELTDHYVVGEVNYLDDCMIDGKLYGIPQLNNIEISYDSEGFFYRKDLLNEWGLDEVTDIDSMENYLYRAKKDEKYAANPLITDNRIWQSLWIMLGNERYVEVESMQETPFVVIDTETGTVVNRLETDEFRLILSYIKKWRVDGILASDMLSLSDNEGTRGIELMADDKKPCETNVPIWSISSNAIRILSDTNKDWKFDFFPYVTQRGSFYTNSLSSASVISVSSKCRNPLLALKFIEKVHTDSRYYDLLLYGAEGINYHLIDNAVSYEGIDSADRFSYSIMGDYIMDKEKVPYNQQFYEDAILEHNEWIESVIDGALHNVFNDSEISYSSIDKEIDILDSIRLQYFQPLVCGYYDDIDQKLDELNKMLYENGFDTYVDSIQSQIK